MRDLFAWPVFRIVRESVVVALALEIGPDRIELPATFVHHLIRGSTDRFHRQCTEQEGQQHTAEHSAKHLRIHQCHIVERHVLLKRCASRIDQLTFGVTHIHRVHELVFRCGLHLVEVGGCKLVTDRELLVGLVVEHHVCLIGTFTGSFFPLLGELSVTDVVDVFHAG